MTFKKKTIKVNKTNPEASEVMNGKGDFYPLRMMTDDHIVNLMAGWQGRIINLTKMTRSLGRSTCGQISTMTSDLNDAISLCNYVLLRREGRNEEQDDENFLGGFL